MRLPTLYRYIMREIFALFSAILIVLLAIILSFRLAKLLSQSVAGNMSLAAVWQLIGLQAVNMLIILIPVALMLSIVMTLSRLYSEQEMSAIFASGISKMRIQGIVLLSTAPICVLLLFLTLNIMPDVYRQISLIRNQAQQQASFALLNPNSFRSLDRGISIHTGNQNANVFEHFFIAQHQDGKNSVIFAETGQVQDRDQQQFLVLGQGRRIAWSDDLQAQNASYSKFSGAELHLPQNDAHADERLRNLPTAALNFTSREHLAEWQTRLNPAIAMLIFSFCLVLLAHTGPRKGRQQKLLPAFLLFALYSSLLENIVKMIDKGKLAPLPGSFILHGIILIIILIFWFKARKAL